MTMTRIAAALSALSFALAVAPAMSAPPEWAGQGKGKGHDRERPEDERHEERRDERHAYFTETHRGAVQAYYHDEYRRGHCPPGLAKKHNGCMPPGQARKWRVGAPLPPDVVIYDVPPALVVRLGVPPAGQKYVRVAADILLIAVGTKLVVDSVHDLGRL